MMNRADKQNFWFKAQMVPEDGGVMITVPDEPLSFIWQTPDQVREIVARLNAALPTSQEAVERAHDAAVLVARCGICSRQLDTEDKTTANCGGDCLRCMADIAEDPDCIRSMAEIYAERAASCLEDQPEPDAPAPDAMHTEMVNIMLAKCGGKITRPKAEDAVTAILQKQMAFYAQMASPDLTADAVEQMAVVTEMMGLGNAVIRQGALMTEHMLPQQREQWQSTVTRYRDTLTKMAEMFS